MNLEVCLSTSALLELRKYAQAYESNYMTEQLGKLVMAISKYTINTRKDEGIVSRQPVRELGKHGDTSKIMISLLPVSGRWL